MILTAIKGMWEHTTHIAGHLHELTILTLCPTQPPVRRSEPSMSLLLVLASSPHDMSYIILKLEKKHLSNGVSTFDCIDF
jgi:hypothetical protein